jgi:hypothetical protein
MVAVGEQPAVLAVDHYGNGWLSGEQAAAFSLGREPVLPPAYAPGLSSGDDAVVIGDVAGYIHALSISGWDAVAGSWPVATGGLSAPPLVMETETGIAVAAADNGGKISVFGSSGEEEYFISLPSGEVNKANLAASVDSSGITDRLIFLSAGNSSVNLRWWNFEQDQAESVQLPIPAEGLDGNAVIAAGDILPERDGLEVYLALLRSGDIYLCCSEGILFERDLESRIYRPALVDINGDRALDLVVAGEDIIYAISPSGANLTGWPREIRGLHNFKLREKIAAPPSAVGSESGAKVMAITRNGILMTLDHRGDLLGGDYPERIAGAVKHPPLFTELSGAGVLTYIDILNNGSGEYYDNRPERRVVRWMTGPFSPGEISTSWFGSSGDMMRRSFAAGTGRWNSPAQGWADLDDNLIIYPNPVEGGRVGFQFRAPSGSYASLMVFNISGEIVLEREKRCEGGEEHEIPVSMTDTGAGVYIARLVVTSGGRSVRTLKKFAVIN